jgi:hypothetical protein
MKIRPLHDRVLKAAPKEDDAAFQPDGTPVRAKGDSAGEQTSEKRIPSRLTHRERSAASSDEYGRLEVKFSALEKTAKAERERVNRPDFGAASASAESGDVRFGNGQRGARPSSRGGSDEVEAARRTLASLERELAAIEKELAALEQRDRVIRKKPGRTTYAHPD